MADSNLQNRYLVVARVGDHSLHQEWIHPAEFRNFDLCLSYYGNTPGRYAGDCEIYTEAKGAKWPKLYDLVHSMGDRIFQYDAVWFPDDDIRTHPGNISRMFELFMENKLQLAQPALTANSYFQVTVQHIDYKLRYTNFVEIMAPILSRDALRVCYPTFHKSVTGWGMEYVWAKLLGYPDKGMAILDETPVKHTRPPGQGELYENIKKQLKIDVWDPKYKDVWNEYEIEIKEPSEIGYYDGIKKWEPYTSIEDHEEKTIRQNQTENDTGRQIKLRRKKLPKGKVRPSRLPKKSQNRKAAVPRTRKRAQRKTAASPLSFTKIRPRRISLARPRLKKRLPRK